MIVHEHPSGLKVSTPEGAAVAERTAAGFLIKAVGATRMRFPTEVQLELRPGAAPAGEWPQTRTVGAHRVHHELEIVDGGSGGQEQILNTWVPAGEGHLWTEQVAQTEPPAKPDFSLTWTMLEGLQLPTNWGER